jgi:hypothetical protein
MPLPIKIYDLFTVAQISIQDYRQAPFGKEDNGECRD